MNWPAERIDRLRALRATGLPNAAIAETMGLPARTLDTAIALYCPERRRPGRADVAIERPATVERVCLNCRLVFPSTGPGNRLCVVCRTAHAEIASTPDSALAGARFVAA